MSQIAAIDRRHVQDALKRLISTRQRILQLLTDRVNGADVCGPLDEAIVEARRSAAKLARYHPDAEELPIDRWHTFRELSILAEAQRGKYAGMSPEEIGVWQRRTIAAMKAHTGGIVDELQRAWAVVKRDMGMPGRPSSYPKAIAYGVKERSRKSPTGWKDIYAEVKQRALKWKENIPKPEAYEGAVRRAMKTLVQISS